MLKHCLVACLPGAIVVPCVGQATTPEKPAAGTSKPAVSSPVVLADGTPVKLKVGPAVNTAALRVGDTIELMVVEDVMVGDVAVVSTSDIATAVVTSQRSRLAKTDANKVDVNLRSVTLPDGERVPLRLEPQGHAGGPAETVTSSAGQDVAIANGGEVTAYIVGSRTLDLTRLQLAARPTGEIRISSTPASAEVSIDGRTLGMAPYTAHVTRGEHAIVLRVAGYEPWRNTVQVGSDPVDLQIQLRRQDSTEPIPQTKAATLSLGELARQARAKRAAQEPTKAPEPASGNPASAPPSTPQN